ncbi:phosphohydrolase, partial [Aquimarina celericrescens]|nr:phosphohydrolase [Aquimarina celericrescens]
PWQYENLYAPFDFAIAKTQTEIEAEKKEITDNVIPYFEYDTIIATKAKESYDKAFSNYLSAINQSSAKDQAKLFGRILLNDIYRYGV